MGVIHIKRQILVVNEDLAVGRTICDSMEDEVSYDILFARYIEKKTLERIAESLHYSFRQITRLHGKALQEFEKKYGYLYLGEENLFRPS